MTVTLDPTRPGRDASKIGEEVIAHQTGLCSAQVTITLDIEASVPNGVPDNMVRTGRKTPERCGSTARDLSRRKRQDNSAPHTV